MHVRWVWERGRRKGEKEKTENFVFKMGMGVVFEDLEGGKCNGMTEMS